MGINKNVDNSQSMLFSQLKTPSEKKEPIKNFVGGGVDEPTTNTSKEVPAIVFNSEKKQKKITKSFSLSEKYVKLIETTAKSNKIPEVKALENMLDMLLQFLNGDND